MPEKITLLGETVRHIKEGEFSGAADIWLHEGVKRGVENFLYFAGMSEEGRETLARIGPQPTTKADLTTSVGSMQLDGLVGIAPGIDKTGNNILGWQELGAHHITVGGVPFYSQAGNEMPRLFTFDGHIGDHGTTKSINRYGFYSPGSDKVVRNIARQRETGAVHIPVIVQVTANKEFYEEANRHLLPEIIAMTVRKVIPVADGISFGLSSPNTLGMRDAQAYEFLNRIVSTAMEAGEKATDRPVPYIFKGDGDGGDARLDMYCRLAQATGIHLELINTTGREDIKARYGAADVSGGLAGADSHYQAMADHAVRYVYEAVGDRTDIIGTGGVNSANRAVDMMAMGSRTIGIATAVRELGLRAVRTIELGIHDRISRSSFSVNSMVGYRTTRRPSSSH